MAAARLLVVAMRRGYRLDRGAEPMWRANRPRPSPTPASSGPAGPAASASGRAALASPPPPRSPSCPIILSQIENEFGPLEWDQGEPAKAYASWAANLVTVLNTGVPWIMCKEDDAPDPIINTCNGFYCDWFSPNKPHKPTLWTEAWSACGGIQAGFGIPVPHRPVEDLAYGVAKFIQKGGSFVNYYMYHRKGGSY